MSPDVRVEMEDGYVAVRSGADARLRVLFFPHAGGSAISLLPLASELPQGTESLLFDRPGRGVRDGEPRLSTFEEARRDLTSRVEPLLDRPTILFGHSLGGLLGDAVVRSLSPERRDRIRKVIVSSAPSPRRAAAVAATLPSPPGRRSRADLLAHLTDYGGTPAEVFSAPELLESVIEAFGDDMLLMDSYGQDPACPVPETDYELWTGREDASTALDELQAWAEAVERPLRERVFPGGHFYLTEQAEARATLRRIAGAELQRLTSPHDQEALT
ncbi:MAG: thioesterase [Streptomyces sp.]|nr:thioesterase [Streptomyces sp.]NUT27235.1 thioesterase [Streptomyces sp.]